MKRITYWGLSTLTCLVLLFGYHTSTAGALATSASSSFESRTSGSSPSSAPSTPSAPATPGTSSGSGSSGSSGSSGTSGTATTLTVTGSVADTQWGPVQVQLTVKAARITTVNVLQYPNGNPRDAQINDTALPILIKETLDKQSADIDMVSGATVTSTGYVQSLQSAVDQAHL